MTFAKVGAWIGRTWPVSALLSWLVALGLAQQAGWVAGAGAALGLALLHRRPWRRWAVALGPPVAWVVQGVAVPAWGWLAAALLLLALYPHRHWGDAPLFLTPAQAFRALPDRLPLPSGARLLDAGCGSGAALQAWRRAYPHLRLFGTEASWPLASWARWRCPWAQIRCADLWTDDWRDFDVVYLFQRPESMPAALAKAQAEHRPGGWLVSLDFPLPGQTPLWTLPVGRHRVLVYARDGLN